MVGRWGSQPADHTPFRSWRLPDLFFLSGFSDAITSVSDGSIRFSQLFLLLYDLSPCTTRPPRGREEARSAGRWGSVEGWPCAIPPCEERGAAARRDEHFRQTMTGEFRAGHGRQRSRTGGEDQADATTGGR